MARLTEEMKAMIQAQQCFIGTADENGVPNVAPKQSTRVLDDETLIFTEVIGRRTYENLKKNPRVAVAVVNREILDGYRFVGQATLHESGELYDRAAAATEKAGFPRPKAVVTIKIEEIYTLKPALGGTRIG